MEFLKYLKGFILEARRRNGVLFYLALVLLILFMAFIPTFGVCGNTPLAELCYWLKPFKFAISFAIYVFTLGWLMEYLKPIMGNKRVRVISIRIAALVILEMGVIFLQSILQSETYANLQFSEKTTENISTVLHYVGNGGILANTTIVTYVAFHFFLNVPLQPISYLVGIRIGFSVFVLSCILGIFLLLHYGQVPLDHEHFGFPFTQLASTRNILISLHFVGIHALQIFPLMGYYLKKQIAYSTAYSLLGLYICATGYFIAQVMNSSA